MIARRILILSPGNPCRNPRPVKEAAALAQAGFSVTLLTGGNPALADLDQDALSGIDCRFFQQPDPRDLLSRARRWLACRANRVGLESVLSLGNHQALLRRCHALPADLTIVHNELAHAVGLSLMKEGRAIAADFEDWHSEDLLPSVRKSRPLRLLRKQEQWLLRHARYCSTTSEALAEALYRERGGKKPLVITNSFPLQPAPESPANATPALFWYSQTIGPGRGLEAFLAAWKNTRAPSRLVLLGEASPDYRTSLLAGLSPSFAQRVEFLPLVRPHQLPALIARHDIGLALEDRSIRNRDLTITNKILQYLNAGLAVVATDTAGQREVLSADPSAGIIVQPDNGPAYTEALDQLLGSHRELARRRTAARALAENRYCWELEAPKLVSAVTTALSFPKKT